MRLFQLKLLIFFPSIFFISCSVELLNFQKDYNNLHLNVINEAVWFDFDSLLLVKSTTINFSKVTEKVICNLSNDIIHKEKSFWSFFDFIRLDEDGVKYNYYPDYPLSFNNDSSFTLLVADDITNEEDLTKHLFLINVKNCETQKVIKISSPNNYISERIPFSTYTNANNFIDHKEKYLCFVGNPAKWLDRNNFIVCTNDSIYIFHTDELDNPVNVMEAEINSNFQVIDSLIINQTNSNIELIDYKNKTMSILFNESFSVALNKSDKYIYFAKGWSLYRSPTNDVYNIQKIYKTDNTIKDYIILNDDKFIIRCGDFTTVPEWNRFYLVDLKTNEINLFENTSLLKSYDLTTDKKHFILRKKIIQGSTYNVLCVFDLQNKRKYEFDDETLPDK